MTARRLLLAAAALLVGVAVSACASSTQADETTGGYVSGDGTITSVDPADRAPAPELAGESLGGDPVALSDFAGSPVVVNVWGSWCADCREEASDLAALADSGVEVLGINIRDSRDAALAYDENYGITYPSIYDPSGETLLGFRDSLPAIAVPTTYVIDSDGRVAARVVGATSEATLRGLVEDAGAA
ncbi:thiol-disulfide isomerase/thioredoxin [Mumia flava]|uniref:Thiol-disulfide isomerase/thioredoxin n=1 Tax=Mumia flava TaxID=1348852 RepID=A0A0B2BQK0_9ACTN|nr:TlpA disulfide reductase family protein [Mumia flava]PJJ58180.1 thiol-disulfide isomerase/thioredoxin [Mumia flava]